MIMSEGGLRAPELHPKQITFTGTHLDYLKKLRVKPGVWLSSFGKAVTEHEESPTMSTSGQMVHYRVATFPGTPVVVIIISKWKRTKMWFVSTMKTAYMNGFWVRKDVWAPLWDEWRTHDWFWWNCCISPTALKLWLFFFSTASCVHYRDG